MLFVRQGATHKVVLGPAVAVADGLTPVTNLALSTADEAEVILHDNGTVVDISAYTWAAIATADGYYHLTLQSGISNTVGHMTVLVNDDSLVLPLRQDFTILDTAPYDAMYADAAAGPLQSTTAGRKLDVSATGEAGIDWANVGSPTTAVDLSATTIDLCDQVTVCDEIAAVQTEVDKIGTIPALDGGAQTIGAAIAKLADDNGGADFDAGTDSLQELRDHIGDGTNLTEAGGTGNHLTVVPWNAAWDAEVQSEVNDALVVLKLDHLVAVADADDVVDDSIMGKIASTDGDWSNFSKTTDSLQSNRDHATTIKTDTAATLVDTAVIGAKGAGLTDVGVKKINDVTITGTGVAGDKFRPA